MPTSLFDEYQDPSLTGDAGTLPTGSPNPLAPPGQQGPQSLTAPAPTPPAPTDDLDITPDVDELMRNIQQTGFNRAVQLQEMFMKRGLEIDPNVLTPQEQESLNAIIAKVTNTVGEQRDRAVEILSNRGLGRSTNIAEAYGRFTREMLQGISDVTVPFVTQATQAKRDEQQHYFDLSTKIQDMLVSGQLDYAKTLISAWDSAASRDLSREQMQMQRDMFNQNLLFDRDKFTEEQKQNMIKNGFTQLQIDNAEKQLAFEREMRVAEFTATTDLARRNQDLQEQVQLGRLSLDQVKNNFDMDLQTRAFELKKELDINAAVLERDKFEAYALNLEREYGLNINRFELAKFIETGRLSNDILNSQRALDLQEERQANEFYISKEKLQLERELGMSDLEIRFALGKAQISVQEEANAIQRLAVKYNYEIERGKLELEIKKFRAQQSARKGGLFGKILGGIVKIGAGFLAGGPAGAAAAILGQTVYPAMTQASQDRWSENQIGATGSYSRADWTI